MNRFLILLFLVFAPALAKATLSSCIPPIFTEIADEYGLSDDIFYAISLAESGRYIKGVGYRVWPWALNISGEAFYPESRAAAAKLIKQELASGNKKIGVGILQVDWRYHESLFHSNPMDSLQVAVNVRAGAKIFKQFLNQSQDEWEAVGYYHAGRSKRTRLAAARYRLRVAKVLEKHVIGGCHALSLG